MAKYIVYVDNGKDIVYHSDVPLFAPYGFTHVCVFDKTSATMYAKFNDAKRVAERLGSKWKVEKVEA